MKYILLIFVAFILGFTQIPGLSGKWNGYFKTPDGESRMLQYDFQLSGEKLTGTTMFPGGNKLQLQNGVFKDSIITFDLQSDNQASSNKGKYYGDSIGLDASVSNGIVYHLTLHRVQ